MVKKPFTAISTCLSLKEEKSWKRSTFLPQFFDQIMTRLTLVGVLTLVTLAYANPRARRTPLNNGKVPCFAESIRVTIKNTNVVCCPWFNVFIPSRKLTITLATRTTTSSASTVGQSQKTNAELRFANSWDPMVPPVLVGSMVNKNKLALFISFLQLKFILTRELRTPQPLCLRNWMDWFDMRRMHPSPWLWQRLLRKGIWLHLQRYHQILWIPVRST